MHRAAPYDAHDPHANTYLRTWLTMHGTKQQRADAVIQATHLPATVATILRSIDTVVNRETLVQLLDGAQVSWRMFADYDSIILAHATEFPPTSFTPTHPTSNSPRTQAIIDAYVDYEDDLRSGRALAPPHGPSTDDDTPEPKHSPKTQAILDAYDDDEDDLRTGRVFAPPTTDDDTPTLINDSDSSEDDIPDLVSASSSDTDNMPDPSSSSDSDTIGPPDSPDNDADDQRDTL
jgi:hypothetical protein